MKRLLRAAFLVGVVANLVLLVAAPGKANAVQVTHKVCMQSGSCIGGQGTFSCTPWFQDWCESAIECYLEACSGT